MVLDHRLLHLPDRRAASRRKVMIRNAMRFDAFPLSEGFGETMNNARGVLGMTYSVQDFSGGLPSGWQHTVDYGT